MDAENIGKVELNAEKLVRIVIPRKSLPTDYPPNEEQVIIEFKKGKGITVWVYDQPAE
jgi:hypothetical protein